MTSTTSPRPLGPVKLRVCNGEAEQVVTASVEAVEEAFGSAGAARAGTEISLSCGERTLVALSVGTPYGNATGAGGEFLLSSVTGEDATLSGPVGQREALRQFRDFVLATPKAVRQ